ncbi:glycosyltransferase [Plantactinospora sp. S1510]|uniref:Glycosyltransferase n=1 Tax=Plantactinospora alkalitolerans TaxID=2789879 RepID=A0ABS0H3V0_9ACTN|nr:cellulose synthase catalytic subunit [Plantactinospora alkalitolerans]MBF9132804.1 glycosyltransferase [Plantactinospora alkalitolerans]
MEQVVRPDPSGRVVRYRQVADPWHRSVLYRAWAVLLVPYLCVRIVWTDPTTVLGPVALAVDLVAVLVTAAGVLPARRLYVPRPGPAEKDGLVIDCLLPTHLEDVAIIEPTVIAARRIRGVRRVLLLGNAERSEVRHLCRRYDVTYLPRGTNMAAKAGNLNNGLRHTDADLVLVLDADHIARPDLLDHVVGYFDDSRVAYVQAPQTYYNTGSFLFRPLRDNPTGWNEQYPFYLCQQLARNAVRAPMFMGSTAVLRRAALDEIGGFAEGSVTEDVHTSLRLHARGWTAVSVPEPLAFGLEATSFREYHTQRRRWAAGALELLVRSPDSPLRTAGLSFRVRLVFLGYLLGQFAGLARLGLLLVPMAILLTGESPVTVPYLVFGPVWVGWYLLSLAVTVALHRGTTLARYLEAYAWGVMPALVSGALGVLVRTREFAWSRKDGVRVDRHWARWVLPMLLAGALGSVGWALRPGAGWSAQVGWNVSVALYQAAGLALFLGYLRRFERARETEPGTGLAGAARVDWVLDRLAAGELGPPHRLARPPLSPDRDGRPAPAAADRPGEAG